MRGENCDNSSVLYRRQQGFCLMEPVEFRYRSPVAARESIPVRVMLGEAPNARVIAGAADVLYSQSVKYELLVRPSRRRVECPGPRIYDAAILRMRSPGQIQQWLSFKRPIVVINNRLGRLPYARVVADDLAVGRMAAEYFLLRGFKHFVYCADKSEFGRLRGDGFANALKESGIENVQRWQGRAGSTGMVPIRELLSRHPGEQVAVFCCNDWRAHSVIHHAAAQQLRCPHDLSVLGVDNDSSCNSSCHVPISTIELPDYEIGQRAAELVVGMLRGQPPPTEPILVPPVRVIGRKSSDRYATSDPVLRRALRFMETNMGRSISVADIAEAASRDVSLRTLQRRFRQAFGVTMVDALLRTRIDRTKTLLAAGNLSIKEIAYVTGFADPSHLRTTFRRFEGMSPGAFRKRVLSDLR